MHWTEADLRVEYHRLLAVWIHHGRLDEWSMPRSWQMDVAQLRCEVARRGVQLRLF